MVVKRRPHKKSKKGCKVCKSRHIKCDETRPSCTNCLTIDRVCCYDVLSLPPWLNDTDTPIVISPHSPSVSQETTQAITPSSSVNTPSYSQSISSPNTYHESAQGTINMRHMELLNHFIFDTASSFDDNISTLRETVAVVVSTALSAPYLMHQVLALSALHLSHTRTTNAVSYREEAMNLQTNALSLFNDYQAPLTAENRLPMFMFASLLGLHALGEATAASEIDADGFLDNFVTYLNLHRGVRAVIGNSWESLRSSEISPILTRAMHSVNAAPPQWQERGQQVADHLHRLLEGADMSTEAMTACQSAVDNLRLSFQSEPSPGEAPDETGSNSQLVWAWPVLLPAIFPELLMRRQPEALIILCHYAVLLHRRRHIWLVGRAGHMLIMAITKSLGTYWRSWLDLPNQILEEPAQ